jgi:hypothetical protein
VAEIDGVQAEVFFEGEGEKPAGQLEGPDRAILDDGRSAAAGADAEKGEAAAAGECLKMAAGVGDAVHFVERVGKIRHARWGVDHRWKAAKLALLAALAMLAELAAFF